VGVTRPDEPHAFGSSDSQPSSPRAAWGAAALILLVAVAHLLYLTINCPIDLAEDEAYYWDWSRALDWSYFSKGPMTALLIRASCAIFGDRAWAVRLPAVLMRAGVGWMMYWLARRILGSDRRALLAVALGYLTPLFLAAGLIMTTDPAYLFFWGAATCLGYAALFEKKRWMWPAAGAVAGLGFLTKFAMPLWFLGIATFMLLDRNARPALRTRWPWLALATFAPFILPPLLWNARHGWVTARHVGEDIGVMDGAAVLGNALDFWTGQLAVAGPLFLFVLAGVVTARSRAARYLLCIGLPVFVGVFLTSLRHHPSGNWTMAAYFTFLILAADWIARRWTSRSAMIRTGVGIVLGVSVAMVVIAHNTTRLYPVVGALHRREVSWSPRKVDPAYRLYGWSELGASVSKARDELGGDVLVMAHDYQSAAALAFYVKGQPSTYCVGSWLIGPDREPFSQYDFWPNRRLDHVKLKGRPAVYVGPMNAELREAFGQVERLPNVRITRQGVLVREFEVWKCRDFKGLRWPGWMGHYNK
jgi:undecaprenyl-diphosphatase